MSALFRRKTAIEKRLDRIHRELTGLDGNIQTVRRKIIGGNRENTKDPADNGKVNRPDTAGARHVARDMRVKDRAASAPQTEGGKVTHDERFLSYLMTSDFQGAGRPLRHERKIQRNKAIIVSVFALVVLLWVLFRFLV